MSDLRQRLAARGLWMPPGIPRISDHPITADLAGAWIPLGEGGVTSPFIRDLVSTAVCATKTGTPVIVARPAGLAFVETTSNTSLASTNAAVTPGQKPANAYTVVVFFGTRGNQSNASNNIISSTNTNGSLFPVWNLIRYSNTGLEASTNNGSATQTFTSSTGLFASNGALVCAGVSVTLGGDYYFAVNGLITNSGTVSSGTISYNGGVGGTPITIGTTGTGKYTNTDIYAAFMWNRQLSPGELAQVTTDPTITLLYPEDAIFAEAMGAYSSGVTISLTGVHATGAVGLLIPDVEPKLIGVSASGNVESITPDAAGELAGVFSSGAAGSLIANPEAKINLRVATGYVGSLAPETEIALTGVSAAGATGSLTPNTGGEVTVTGVLTTGYTGSLAPDVEALIAGVQATGHAGSLTTGTGGEASITGVMATAAVGSFLLGVEPAIVGVAATAKVGSLSEATFILSGVVATGAVGLLESSIGAFIAGVSAYGEVGQLGVTKSSIGLEGVEAVGHVGRPFILIFRPRRRHPWWPVTPAGYPIPSILVPTPPIPIPAEDNLDPNPAGYPLPWI